MSDYVSRQAVIDYLMINMNWYDEDDRMVDDWSEKKPIITDLINGVPSGWISIKDRMPVETHSIFWPWYGKKEWSNAMWREQSDKVLVTVAFKDGSRIVTAGETHDGVWNTTISRTLEPVVTHWMAMPEPPKEKLLGPYDPVPTMVARELNIRHDDKDGDV